MTKKVYLIILIILLIVGVNSCAKVDIEDITESMLSYMSEKYGEEFEVYDLGTQVWSSSYAEMDVKSKKHPDSIITIRKNYSTGTIGDNYVSILLKKGIEDKISDMASQVYPNNIVVFTPTSVTLPPDYDKNTTVDKYCKEQSISFILLIDGNDTVEDREQDLEDFRQILQDAGYKCTITAGFLNEGCYDELVNTELDSTVFNDKKGYVHNTGVFIVDKEFNFKSVEWND